MGFREISVVEVREVLRARLAGTGLRMVAGQRDRPYRPLPTSAVCYLLALITRHLTLPAANVRRRFRRRRAAVLRTHTDSRSKPRDFCPRCPPAAPRTSR
jgi:hypothetical protein